MAILAYREKERLTLIHDVERVGAILETQPPWLPGFTGVVTGVSIPQVDYLTEDFPPLTRFRHIEKFRLTDFKSEGMTSDGLGITADALEVIDPKLIRRFADRTLLDE